MVSRQFTIRGSRGKYPYNEGRHLMAVLELYAYADESGIQKAPPYCVVAGYIASARSWETFRGVWKSVLNKYGVEEFHAKEFFGRNPSGHSPYAHFSRAKATAFISEIVSVVNRHRIYPMGGMVDVKAFNNFTLGERKFLTGAYRKGNALFGPSSPNQPYYIPFRWFIQMALDKTPMGAKIHFVFDQQGERAGLSLQIFDTIKKLEYLKDNGRLGDMIFADSKEKAEVQAADMISHLSYVYMTARKGHGRMNSERREAMSLLKRKDAAIAIFEADALEKSLATAGPEFRAYLHSIAS